MSFDEEFVLEYPEISGEWESTDGQLEMTIADREDGDVYEITVEEAKDGTTIITSIYGEYEMSTGNVYYWSIWTGEEGQESDAAEEGWFAVNEDGTLSWVRGGEESARFSRAE